MAKSSKPTTTLDALGDDNPATLKAEIARLTAELEAARTASRKDFVDGPKRRRVNRATRERIRFIIPDTHGALVDKPALGAALDDLARLDADEVVLLGDHLECGGFLAQHHTLGYVAQSDYTFSDDIEAANQFLDALQERAPQAHIHYLEGNHESRIEKWCVTQALKNCGHGKADARALLDRLAPEVVLKLKERGIPYYKRSQTYMDVPIQGTIKLGRCYFTHGISTAKHAASVHLQRFGGCVVYGHTHRRDAASDSMVYARAIGAWSPGCLCALQPLWQHTNPTSWSHGYGLQTVSKSGDFQHINVLILDDRSLLMPVFKGEADAT